MQRKLELRPWSEALELYQERGRNNLNDNSSITVLLELMIPPTKRPGSVVVTHPASHGEVVIKRRMNHRKLLIGGMGNGLDYR